MYVCPPDGVPGCFALITLVHVLEHVPAPWRWMARLVSKLDEDGFLLVQVPDYRQNPFDMLIADHRTHFSQDVLEAVVRRAGFEPILVADDWVVKEVSVVARKGRAHREESAPPRCSETLAGLLARLEWLNAVRDAAGRASLLGPFGVFGTSIAGTWLFSELEDRVSFFVDEDPHRIGRTHMGRPIYHPSQVRAGSHVFLALPERLARAIAQRLQRPGVTFHPPPGHDLG